MSGGPSSPLRARWTAATNRVRLWTFGWSSHARTWRGLRGRYRGERCFVVGNGPSLRPEDLDAIGRRPSFGFNRIHHVFPRTSWRPTFYCSEDPRMLAGCLEEVRRLEAPYKFIPYPLVLWYGLEVPGATCFLLESSAVSPDASNFRPDPVRGFRWGGTVAFTALQMAAHMGFADIVLLGIDHRFARSTNDRGDVLVDEGARDYFDPAYDHDRHLLDTPNLERSTNAFLAARRWADLHGVRIRNATRGGRLEVFDRIDLDAVLAEGPPDGRVAAREDGAPPGGRRRDA